MYWVLTITATDGSSSNQAKVTKKKLQNPSQLPAAYHEYDIAEQTVDGLYHLANDTGGVKSEYTLAEEINPTNAVQNEDEYQLADSSGEDYANFDSIQR